MRDRPPFSLTVSQNAVYFFACIVPLSIFLGLASGYRILGEGRDFQEYVFFYRSLQIYDDGDSTRFEFAFFHLSKMFKFNLSENYYIYFSFVAFFSLFLKFLVFLRQKNVVATTLFYIIAWFPLHEYTQIRAAFAVSILFIATECLLTRKWIPFLLLSALAGLFHTSALLVAGFLVGVFFLAELRLSLAILLIAATTIVLTVVTALALDILSKFNPLIVYYAQNVGGNEVPNIFSAQNIASVLFLVSMLFSGTLVDRRVRVIFLLCCSAMAVFIGFHEIPTFAHRLKEMLLVFMTLIAFNAPLTWRTLPQMFFGAMYAVISFLSYSINGIIWGG